MHSTMLMIKEEKPSQLPNSVQSLSNGLQQQQQNRWNTQGSYEFGMSLGRDSPLSVGVPDTPGLLQLSPVQGSFSNSNGGPSSPSFVIGSGGNSFLGSGGGSNGSSATSNSIDGSSTSYPPNHPLSGSKHLCSICGDRASGKHYGVFSCEGCKGFFKRTVRKELSYSCREHKQCIIDKRQRNRCQYCRYRKCLEMGMKREAVQELRSNTYHLQEERQRTKEKNETVEPAIHPIDGAVPDMPLGRIREAEMLQDVPDPMHFDLKPENAKYDQAAKNQMEQVVRWARHIPHFTSLPLTDQMILLKMGWNELLIAAFAHRSINVRDEIVLANGVKVDRNTMQDFGLDCIFDRVLSELVAKMREMKVDTAELGCLKTIVLYNPDAKNLTNIAHVETLREKVYGTLEEYTKNTYPNEPGRFPKLLLRLPSLRSIGLKCTEHLFFLKDWGSFPKQLLEAPIDKYLLGLLDEANGVSQQVTLS